MADIDIYELANEGVDHLTSIAGRSGKRVVNAFTDTATNLSRPGVLQMLSSFIRRAKYKDVQDLMTDEAIRKGAFGTLTGAGIGALSAAGLDKRLNNLLNEADGTRKSLFARRLGQAAAITASGAAGGALGVVPGAAASSAFLDYSAPKLDIIDTFMRALNLSRGETHAPSAITNIIGSGSNAGGLAGVGVGIQASMSHKDRKLKKAIAKLNLARLAR